MKRIHKRKIKNISVVSAVFLCFILVLAGCGNKIKRQMEKAINDINLGKYSEARKELETILKEYPSNSETNSEVNKLISIINSFEDAKKSYEDREYSKANEEISEIPNEYSNYNIKSDVDNLKENINKKLDEIKQIDNKINELSKLINDGKLDDASKKINEFKDKELTETQNKKLNDLKDKLNKKIEQKKAGEKKAKEEQKKKEEERKLEGDRQKKQKEENLKKNYSNSKTTKNNKVTNSTKNQKDIQYVNKKLGIQITFPASWRGLYTIKSYNNGIGVFMKAQEPYVYDGEGFLFSVTEYKSAEDAEFKDTVGNKRFVTAKGKKYIIGGPTDVPIGYGEKNRVLYLNLNKEKYSVANTIKAIE